jgi:release factor glutamine methyltransferase
MAETLLTAWSHARRTLEGAGLESPVLESRQLVEAAFGVARRDIVTDPYREAEAVQLAALETLLARRLAREPLAYIVGQRGFWKYDFHVTPAVLIPRPETEHLVEVGLELIAGVERPRVLDLGVGSGAVLLSLLADRQDAEGLGLDVSGAAIAVAERNAARLEVGARARFHVGDWASFDVEQPFDLVVSNPPYIVSEEIAALAPEVAQHEPRLALDGGADGLSAYRAILERAPALIRPGGGLAFEVGKGQADAVLRLSERAGLKALSTRMDLLGIDRVVFGRG